MGLPVLKEIMRSLKDTDEGMTLLDGLRGLAGGEALLRQLDDAPAEPTSGDGAPTAP